MRSSPVAKALVVALTVGLGSPALAQRPMRRPPPLDVLIVMNAERLRLDPTTLEAVKQVATAHRDEILRIQEQTKPIQASMRAVFDLGDPDEKEVLELAERIGQAEVEVKKLQLRSAIRMRKLLSAQQRDELALIQKEILSGTSP